MNWRSPNDLARQTMQNPLGFAASSSPRQQLCPLGWHWDPQHGRCVAPLPPPPGPDPQPPLPPQPPIIPGVRTRRSGLAALFQNPVVNAARAVGRLMMGAPSLRASTMPTPRTTGAPIFRAGTMPTPRTTVAARPMRPRGCAEGYYECGPEGQCCKLPSGIFTGEVIL